MNIKNYFSILNKNHILGFKPLEIHGINPKLIYEPTGKEISLPRFSSVEMIESRQMNKLAIHQIRKPIIRKYNKATKEDLQRLTSQTIEDTYSKVEWTNPKDGKIYNLLKQGETDNGNIIVRILDNEGAFIKEAEIKPKTILIPDNYTDPTTFFGIPHGEMSLIYAKRNNPFAKYVKIPIKANDLSSGNELKLIENYFTQGNNADYISCSYGVPVYVTKKVKLPERLKNLNSNNYDKLATENRRILFSSNNANDETYDHIRELSNKYICENEKIEGVGALSHKLGKITYFSESRNSELTQHYELGEFYPKLTKYGVNITGLPGTDLPFPNKSLKKYISNPLLGKPVKKVKNIINKINERIKELEQKKYSLFKINKSLIQNFKEIQKIEQQIHLYQQRKIKILSYTKDFKDIDGEYNLALEVLSGTSISAPIRTAKLALNDMMEGIL